MARSKKTQGEDVFIHESVRDINIDEIIPNVIDNFLITIFEDHHTVVAPMYATGTQFRAWYKGRGGVFSKDVLNYSLNKPHGKYVLIKKEDSKCIARVISEEEEFQFKTLKLVDGKIKDRSYMIIRKLEDEEKLSSTQIYIDEKDIEHEHEENLYIPASESSAQDDDIDHHVGSISLFSE